MSTIVGTSLRQVPRPLSLLVALATACSAATSTQQFGAIDAVVRVAALNPPVTRLSVVVMPADVTVELSYSASDQAFVGNARRIPAGEHTVTATAFTADGLLGTASGQVVVLPRDTAKISLAISEPSLPPTNSDRGPTIVAITATPGLPSAHEPVRLSASALDPDGDPMSYEWSATCATSSFSATHSASTTWTSFAPGTCSVTVRVTSRGLSDSTTLSITSIPAARVELDRPGCVASGAASGASSERLVVFRPSDSHFAPEDGAHHVCGPNELRVAAPPLGALVEAARTNLLLSPDDFASWSHNQNIVVSPNVKLPSGEAAHRILKTAPGSNSLYWSHPAAQVSEARYSLSIDVMPDTTARLQLGLYQSGAFLSADATLEGPGRVSYSEYGADSDGSYAIEGLAPGQWTRITLVTKRPASPGEQLSIMLYPATAALAGGTGSLYVARAALYDSVTYPTTYAASHRAADNVSTSWPAAPRGFCVKARFTPAGRRSWSQSNTTLLSVGAEGATPSATLSALDDGTLSWRVIDAAGSTASTTIAHTFAAASSHELAACASPGGVAIHIDGRLASSAVVGAGVRVLEDVAPQILWLGSSGNATRYFDGFIGAIAVTNAPVPDGLWSPVAPFVSFVSAVPSVSASLFLPVELVVREAGDAIARVWVKVNSEDPAEASCLGGSRWSFPALLRPGLNSVSAWAEDRTGHVGKSEGGRYEAHAAVSAFEATVFPLNSAACASTRAAVGLSGEAIYVSRASKAPMSGSNLDTFSCGVNELRLASAGALIEGPAANLLVEPEAVERWDQGGNIVVTPNAALGPDGRMTADLMTKAVPGAYSVYSTLQAGQVTSDHFAVSVYVKAGTATSIQLGLFQSGFIPVSIEVEGSGRVAFGEYGLSNDGAFAVADLSPDRWTRIVLNTKAPVAPAQPLALMLYPATARVTGGIGSVLLGGAAVYRGPASTYTATARSGDDVFIRNPLTGNTACVKGRFSPGVGRPWDALDATLLAIGREGTPSSAALRVSPGGVISYSVVGGNGLVSRVAGLHGFTGSSLHEVAACMGTASDLAIYADGALIHTSITGDGSGLIDVGAASEVWLGSGGRGSDYFGGWIGDVRLASVRTPDGLWGATLPSPRVLWLSDSIYNTGQLWSSFSTTLGASVIHDTGTYGGTVIGSGLFELADMTYAPAGSSWSLRRRGQPFQTYSAVVMEYMRNDANNGESVSAYRRAYDKLLSQAVRNFPRVLSGNSPPRASPDLSAWDLGSDAVVSGGFDLVLPPLAEKWGSAHVDIFGGFRTLANDGIPVAQLMRDIWHPSSWAAANVLAPWLTSAYLRPSTKVIAEPEVPGAVVNYLYGTAIEGEWTLITGLSSRTGPRSSPLFRIANLSDSANVASSANAVLGFPVLDCVSSCQVWAHFLMDETTGGSVDVLVDAGTPNASTTTVSTRQPGVTNYTRSILIADGVSAGGHTVRMKTATDAPVRVLGVTYVGAR